MPSKTPLFDAALDAYYRDKAPGTFVCKETGETFEITPPEFEMYRSLGVPLPTVAPWVRHRRQRAHLGGLDLFRGTTRDGHPVVTMYDPESPAVVMGREAWYGDAFETTDYGRAYDFEKTFAEQWRAFSMTVPRTPTVHAPLSENSTWSVYDSCFKDCYATHGGVNCERTLYSDLCIETRDCVDCASGVRTERCYDNVECADSSNLVSCTQCYAGVDLAFCLGCRNCSDCFGCANLSHKQFYFLNEPLTEAEYRERMKTIDLTDARVVEEWKQRVREEIWKTAPLRANLLLDSERCSGDIVLSSVDAIGVSSIHLERTYQAFDCARMKDCCDVMTCNDMERSVSAICVMLGGEIRMCSTCESCMSCEYCEMCFASEYCFGCIGAFHKKFCIFNKQYAEEEYWPMVDRIKTQMLAEGSYGEFFPYRSSLMAYNTSHADAWYPLDRPSAEALGCRWFENPEDQNQEALPIDTLPFLLDETTDDVLAKSFRCPESGRVFRIVKPQLALHRAMRIALPRVHPTLRRKARHIELFPFRLYERTCGKCLSPVTTRIPPTHPSPILCETCFEEMMLDAS